jgi:hypothetical protein
LDMNMIGGLKQILELHYSVGLIPYKWKDVVW